MPANFDELLLAESPVATIVIDLTGAVQYWNKGAESLFGHSRVEAIGRSFIELVVPDDKRHEEQTVFGKVATAGSATYETVRRRKDGSLINVLVSSKSMYGDGNEVEYIISTKADVTHLIVQRDAKVVRAKFHDLLESTPDAIIMANPTGHIVLANSQAERLFGYDHDELIGQLVEILLPRRFQPGHVSFRSQYFAYPRARSMGAGLELFGQRRDGTEFPVEISLSPLGTEEGTLVMSAIRDISYRKRIEQALQEKNSELLNAAQAKNRFLANMSHELRTPLNGIIGFAEFLVDGKPGPLNSKQEEYLNDILNSGRHLLQLINDVLDLAKVEAGRMDFFPEAFSMTKALLEVCAVARPIAHKKGIDISTAVSPEVDRVHLDQQKTKQILYNLISNAVKFTENGGRVEVKAFPAQAGLFRLSVTDTGIGIKTEDVKRLFTEFEQLEAGTSRRYEGTGLGLALTKRIVEMQGGMIEVESEIGKGSTFTIQLPCRVEALA